MAVKCVVCGMESDRPDWVGKPNPQCDRHLEEHQLRSEAPPNTEEHTQEQENPDPPKEGPVEHFIHEVEKKVEQKFHPKSKKS